MKLQLPTGRLVELSPKGRLTATPPSSSGPLFEEVKALFRDRVAVADAAGKPIAVDGLALVDFHALRAIAGHEGWLEEEPVTVTCINCEEPLTVTPSELLPMGPFLERKLDDEDLDARLPENEPHAIPAVTLRNGRTAETVTFRSVTVREAAPLHAALGKKGGLVIDDAVVRAMGITALGDETDPRAIAAALANATDEAWGAVGRLFVELHYPLRLFGVARCDACGARNDVDAPFDREFEAAHPAPATSEGSTFPAFEAFADRARKIAEATIAPEHEAQIAFVVEGGVALCDEGGIALLGSYLPGTPGDGMVPSRPHEIAVYYRTFRAMVAESSDDDSLEPFDWEHELEETIEHEYEHFLSELAGGDPVDEDERREIADEAIRIHGKRTLLESEVKHLGTDLGGFLRRTWPLWAIVIAVAALMATR